MHGKNYPEATVKFSYSAVGEP